MKIINKTYQIYDKWKNDEEVTTEEEMIFDMHNTLVKISNVLVDNSKQNIANEETIKKIRKILEDTDKEYKEEEI